MAVITFLTACVNVIQFNAFQASMRAIVGVNNRHLSLAHLSGIDIHFPPV